MASASASLGAPVQPSPEDVELAKRAAAVLSGAGRVQGAVTLAVSLGGESEQFTLPEVAFTMLSQILDEFAQGHAVALAPVDRKVTTQEAAAILGVSRPYVIKQLEAGRLVFSKVGTHRRMRMADVLEYKARMEAEADAAMAELVRLSEEMGLYD
jgi:excisionase family DNA binding protein